MQSHVLPAMAGPMPDATGPGAKLLNRALVTRLAISAAFLIAAAVYAAAGGGQSALLLALAAGFGGYMALNIGANDVANNIGPTVGARVMPIGAALVMAAVWWGVS